MKKFMTLLLALAMVLTLLPVTAVTALAADEPIPVDPPVIEEPAEPEEPPVTLADIRAGAKITDIDADTPAFDAAAYRERQYDLLAQAMRENLDMDMLYRILEAGVDE